MNNVKIGFIGAGNMGAAIMKGISASEAAEKIELYAADPDSAKLEALAEYGVKACSDAADVTEKCDYVFLAVKPQVIEGVLESIAAAVTAEKVLVSIAAGITDEFIASKTIPEAKVILVMPNTPLLLGVNIGGAGTLIASLASLITFGEYNRHYQGFANEYILRFSLYNFSFVIVLTIFGLLFLI